MTDSLLVDHGTYYRPRSILFQVSSTNPFSCPVVYPVNLVAVLEKRARFPQVVHVLSKNCCEQQPIRLPLDSKEYRDKHLVPYVKSVVARQGGFSVKIKEQKKGGPLRMECSSCKSKCGFFFNLHLRKIRGSLSWCFVEDEQGCSHHIKTEDSIKPEPHRSTPSRYQYREYENKLAKDFPYSSLNALAHQETKYSGIAFHCPPSKADGVMYYEDKFHRFPERFEFFARPGSRVIGWVPAEWKGGSDFWPIPGTLEKFQQGVVSSMFAADVISVPDGKEKCLRGEMFCGMSKGWHTDVLKALSLSSLIYFPPKGLEEGQAPFCLTVNLFPKFKSSIVTYKDNKYIPYKYDAKLGNLHLIGPHPEDSNTLVYHVFPESIFGALLPHGDLNVVSCEIYGGNTNNYLRCYPLEIVTSELERDYSFLKVYWKDIDRHCNRNDTIPNPRFYHFSTHNYWLSFHGWQLLHCFTGNPTTPRVNVYHRYYGRQFGQLTHNKTLTHPSANKELPQYTLHPFWGSPQPAKDPSWVADPQEPPPPVDSRYLSKNNPEENMPAEDNN